MKFRFNVGQNFLKCYGLYTEMYIYVYIFWNNNVPNLAFGTRYLPSGSVASLPYVGLIGRIIVINLSVLREVDCIMRSSNLFYF